MEVPLELIERFAEPELAERTSTLETLAPVDIKRRPFLVGMAGSREGELFELAPGVSLVLGRTETCDIRLDDEGISRMHARVTAVGSGRFIVEDMGSRNGTFVGNVRVTQRELQPDDLIRVGSFTAMRFCMLDAVEEEFQRRLASAAIRDPLTGLYNRRHFDERLLLEVSLARRHSRPLSLVMFDVDDFKSINDRHGHRVGDEVLRAVGEALQRDLRREDETFRYGGEEFALLARETPLRGAVQVAERTLAALRTLRITTGTGQVVTVRASAGAAELPDGSAKAAQLVERADAALYAAKRAGKDRVCVP